MLRGDLDLNLEPENLPLWSLSGTSSASSDSVPWALGELAMSALSATSALTPSTLCHLIFRVLRGQWILTCERLEVCVSVSVCACCVVICLHVGCVYLHPSACRQGWEPFLLWRGRSVGALHFGGKMWFLSLWPISGSLFPQSLGFQRVDPRSIIRVPHSP